MSNPHPQWIDEYAKAVYKGFTHMVPFSWGPIDAMALVGFLNGSFLSKLGEAVRKIKTENVPLERIGRCFPAPSSLFVAMYYTLWEYQMSNPKNKEQYREIHEFLFKVLCFLRKKDVFAYESNVIHSREEISELLHTITWSKGNPSVAKELGKLYTSLDALCFALYGDFFPQECIEGYGPYDASKKFWGNTILIIKHANQKIRPIELWAGIKELKYSEVKIFQVYKNVKFTCELIGKHSLYEGDVLENLMAYALMVDGKTQNNMEAIKDLTSYFVKVVQQQFLLMSTLSKEKLKIKVLEWYSYEFVYLFQLAGMDWRPTQAMLDAIKDKEVKDRFELETWPSFEEYVNSPEYEVYWLKDLYK